VRRDDEIAVFTAGNGDGDGRRQSALGASSVGDLADGADVDGVAFESLDESFLEFARTYRIE